MRKRSVGKGDTLRNPDTIMDAMAACRKVLIAAGDSVAPFGSAYHAVHMVVRAIDSLAYYVTGQRDFYSVGGSVGPAGSASWERDKPDASR